MKRRAVLILICGILACGCAKKESPEGEVAELQIGGDISAGSSEEETSAGSPAGAFDESSPETGADSAADTAANPSGSAPATEDPQAQADAYISDYIAKEQTIAFANLTGRDLSELRISFSEGGLQEVELLQGNILRDGAGVHYRIEELSELRTAEHLKLSVSAVATDDTRMEFPAIPIWDISSTNIVLSTEDGEYTMYLE